MWPGILGQKICWGRLKKVCKWYIFGIFNYSCSDAKKDLAWVPIGYISRKDAQRKPFFLSETVSHSNNIGINNLYMPL